MVQRNLQPVCAFSLVALLLSCEPNVTRFDIPVEGDTKSMLFAIEGEEDFRLEAIDIEQSAPWIQFDLPEGSTYELTALLYALPLSDLGIRPGPVLEDRAGRKVPQPAAIFHSPTDEIQWEKLNTMVGRLAAFEIPKGNSDCIEIGGCINRSDRCVIPCPEPTIDSVQPDTALLPNLLPCPAGWIEKEESAVPHCVPWDLLPRCSADHAAFPGVGSCEPIGTDCPVGPFPSPTALPSGSLIYVDRNGTAPQPDGSRDRPYSSIGEAIANHTQTATIVLSTGLFQESFHLPEGASLIGSCTATILSGPSSNSEIVVVTQPSGTISNLKIQGGKNGIVVREGRVQVNNVVIEETERAGLVVELGGTVIAQDLLVLRSDIGIRVHDSTFKGERVETSTCSSYGILAEHQATLDLQDTSVHDTHRRPEVETSTDKNDVAMGIATRYDVVATFRRVVAEHNRDKGVDIKYNTTLDAEDLVILDSYDPYNLTWGRGLRVWQSSIAAIRRLVIKDSTCWGFRLDEYADPPPQLHLEDALILRSVGEGIVLWESSEIDLHRVFIGDSDLAGIWMGREAQARITDLTIQRTEVGTGAREGAGIYVDRSASITVTRLDVQDSEGSAVFAEGTGEIRLNHATLSHSGRDGIRAVGQIGVVLNDVRISDSAGMSVYMGQQSQLSGSRLEVQRAGTGLTVVDALTTAEIEGFVSFGSGSSETKGAFVGNGASLKMRRFSIGDHGVGVKAVGCPDEGDDQILLENGIIERNGIGVIVEEACIEASGMDAVSSNVLFRDNDKPYERR